MRKYLAILLLGFSSLANSQTVQTTPNLITSGTTHTWTGVTTGAIPAGCATAGPCPGGPSPIYDPNTNTVSFSYNSNAYVGQTIAINNALANAGAGIKINGYNYSYEVRNMNGDDRQPGIDTFTVATALRGPANSVLLSSNQYFNTKFDWTSYSGTKTATTPYNMADVSYLQIGIQGGDNGYWGGYFGPQIRNVNMSLKYSVDPCATNPAYSTTCANYNTVSTQTLWSGVTGPQAIAINQALSGSGVMVHGFDYGYSYSVGGRFCNWMDFLGGCLGSWVYPSASMTTTLTNNNGVVGYTETNNHAAGAVGTYSKQLRLNASVPISTMGTFSMTPSTNNGAVINNINASVVYTADPCVVNPLSSTSCSGYQQAYTDLQCSSNPLYSTACAGYQQAYFTQQCNANQMYSPSCPGYAAAYLTYQCNANPLYSTTCPGYEQAYLDQQCGISPLYSQSCSGYSAAYHDQQCRANPLYAVTCTGYTTAYHDQQCSINPLYATTCTGYASAYLAQQCSINPLYSTSCSGYASAYFTQQCNLNGLYDKTCPNYSTAYAKKMLLEQQGIASTVATAGVVAATAPVTTTTASTDSSGEVKVAVVADEKVNTVLTTTATSASPAQAATATVPLVAPPPAPAAPAPEPKKAEPAGDKPAGGPTQMTQGGPSGDKPAQPTARQALAERRAEAAKKDAVEKGKNLAKEMGNASSMEAQKAVQDVVVQAMGFTPGFDTYNKAMLPDTVGYKPFTVYNNQKNIDNRANLRMWTGTDRLHNELVDSQYKEK
jgi:hypothetical protein